MELVITWIIAAASALLTAFAVWKAGRPRKDRLHPSWISWPFVIIVAGAVLLLAAVHLINMAGITTGAGRPGVLPRP